MTSAADGRVSLVLTQVIGVLMQVQLTVEPGSVITPVVKVHGI
jgi:hypothetical protein